MLTLIKWVHILVDMFKRRVTSGQPKLNNFTLCFESRQEYSNLIFFDYYTSCENSKSLDVLLGFTN